MNAHLDRDFVAFVEQQLEDAPRMRYGALADVLSRVESTPQRRGGRWPAWAADGFGPLSRASTFAGATFVVALLGLLIVAQPVDRLAVTVPGAQTEGLPAVTGPVGNGLIAFTRDGDLYVGDPLTGESELIVPGEGSHPILRGANFRPQFSPDGSHIAFGRVIGPTAEGGCDLVVVQADGSDGRVITPEGGAVSCIATLLWTPDSRSIAVEDYLPPDYPLLLLDAVGVEDPVLLPLKTPFGTAASFLRPPDGDRLLTWGGTPALGAMDLDGSDVVDLGELSGLEAMGYGSYVDAGWSPDASRIAVLARAGDERHLYVVEADGSHLRRLAAIPWHEDWSLGPPWSWSPDGTTIAVQYATVVEYSPEACPDETGGDPCAGNAWISLIDVGSGETRVLEATDSPGMGGGSIRGWSWSPDGRSILLTRESGSSSRSRLEVVDVKTDRATELPWEIDHVPSWQRVAPD